MQVITEMLIFHQNHSCELRTNVNFLQFPGLSESRLIFKQGPHLDLNMEVTGNGNTTPTTPP